MHDHIFLFSFRVWKGYQNCQCMLCCLWSIMEMSLCFVPVLGMLKEMRKKAEFLSFKQLSQKQVSHWEYFPPPLSLVTTLSHNFLSYWQWSQYKNCFNLPSRPGTERPYKIDKGSNPITLYPNPEKINWLYILYTLKWTLYRSEKIDSRHVTICSNHMIFQKKVYHIPLNF